MDSLESKIDQMRIDMAGNFGVTKTELTNIKDHLVTLNGKVADNVNKTADITLQVNTQKGLIDGMGSWKTWAMPTMSALITGLAVWIITH